MPNNRELTSGNKGEWSELYAFIRLLKEGKIYAADEDANKLDELFFPIIKIIRQGMENEVYNYFTGDEIRIYKDGVLIKEMSLDNMAASANVLLNKIFEGAGNQEQSGAFRVPEMETFMNEMHIKKIKAPATEKADMLMQIHDTHTGYSPEVGFSVKSDLGSPPTLLNPGKNTRIQYEVKGLTNIQIAEINGINKEVAREYIVERMVKLFEMASDVEFVKIKDETYDCNLVMIDSLLPRIYGQMVLKHYEHIAEKVYDCEDLIGYLVRENPMEYKKPSIYRHKIKKMISASALGMTPGKEWSGIDVATGGYIIIKRDGEVLCYHLYNRNYFEEYLLKNTRFDRPSASRYDYGYIYEDGGKHYLDLNVQIRFKSTT